MIGLLLALYPARWRRRYGEEFRAVLESRPLGPFDVADTILGALDARLTLRFAETSSANGGHHTMLRIGGYGAIGGGLLWIAGFVGASIGMIGPGPGFLLITAGTVGILVALVGLSAFQAHRHPRLAWAACALPAAGALVSLVGLYGMVTMPNSDIPMIAGLGSWSIWAVGAAATVVGCVLFALATLRVAVLSRAGAIGLGGSSLFILVLLTGIIGLTSTGESGALPLFLAMAAFGTSWIVLGIGALRSGPIRTVAAA